MLAIRNNSQTFSTWVGELLSGQNKRQVWISPGFAQRFVVLSETAEFLYKTTDYYALQFERGIAWNDPDLVIDWQFDGIPSLSAKDSDGSTFVEAEIFCI